jgi:hypothetical protein
MSGEAVREKRGHRGREERSDPISCLFPCLSACLFACLLAACRLQSLE